jgi:hypothetical protein
VARFTAAGGCELSRLPIRFRCEVIAPTEAPCESGERVRQFLRGERIQRNIHHRGLKQFRGNQWSVPDENTPISAKAVGLTRKQIHEARAVRDASFQILNLASSVS